MVVTLSTVVEISAFAGALIFFLNLLFKLHSWIIRQEQQDKEIADIKAELRIISKGVYASLDGLEQLGCNHIVPSTKDELGRHVNDKAHE